MDILLLVIQKTAVVWVPILLGIICYRIVMAYKQQYFVNNKIKYVMFELHIPRDIHKSPQAMEFIIDVLHHTGGGAMSWQHRLWFGASLHPASLEMVSIEGNIYFFMRVSHKIADIVKSTIYSQYPQVEIHEVDDYTKYVPNYNTHEHSWIVNGADYELTQDAYIPIKTYVDYGLDKAIGTLEENQKIDPMTPMLEYFASLRPGEQLWLQYIIRADAQSDWRTKATDKIKEMLTGGEKVDIPDETKMSQPRLSFAEQETIKGIERSLSKYAFECIIRCVYIAKKDVEDGSRAGYFNGPMFKPFSSQYFNGIKKKTNVGVDWVWQDFSGNKVRKQRLDFFNDYVNRAGFYPFSWESIFLGRKPEDKIILTSEELATLFHLPGRVSETSNVDRIEATKAEPPANLPL